MSAKFVVRLSEQERDRLDHFTRTGRAHARSIQHARILLLADASDQAPAWSDEKIADALFCGSATVARVRKRFLVCGLEDALRARAPAVTSGKAPGRPPKIDGIAEAHLIALTCSEPPAGRARWSLRLLADRFAEIVETEQLACGPPCYETIRMTLKKTTFGPTG